MIHFFVDFRLKWRIVKNYCNFFIESSEKKLFLHPKNGYKFHIMYWTLELASYLEDAPWPATKEELIDFAIRTGAPLEVVENLQDLEDEGDMYESIEEIWPDYPSREDFLFNEDEY